MRPPKFLSRSLEVRAKPAVVTRTLPRSLLVIIPFTFFILLIVYWLPKSIPVNLAHGIVRWPCQLINIMDGDSLLLNCRDKVINVRLYCIDAPEKEQKPWGDRSRANLKILTTEQLELIPIDTDRYGRTVGEVYTTGKNKYLLNLEQVQSGNAAVYTDFCKEKSYFNAEQEARRAKRGIWSRIGMHQTPWIFRQQQRQRH